MDNLINFYQVISIHTYFEYILIIFVYFIEQECKHVF